MGFNAEAGEGTTRGERACMQVERKELRQESRVKEYMYFSKRKADEEK